MQVFSIKPPVYFFLLLSIVILGFFSNMAENAYSVYLIALPILYICLHAFILELIVSAKELWTKQKLHFLFLSLKNLVLCLFMISAVGKLVNIGLAKFLFICSSVVLIVLLFFSFLSWLFLFFTRKVNFSQISMELIMDVFQVLAISELFFEAINLFDLKEWRIYILCLFFLFFGILWIRFKIKKIRKNERYLYNLRNIFVSASFVLILYFQIVSVEFLPVFYKSDRTISESQFEREADYERLLIIRMNSELFWGLKNGEIYGMSLSDLDSKKIKEGWIYSEADTTLSFVLM